MSPKTFSALKAKVEKDGLVVVIVGLKLIGELYSDTPHPSPNSPQQKIQNAATIEARIPLIAQAQTSFLAGIASYNISSIEKI